MRRSGDGLSLGLGQPASRGCLGPRSMPFLLGGRLVGSVAMGSRLEPKSRQLALWLLGLLASACVAPSFAAAVAHPQTAYPLPESEYGVREVCSPPSLGRGSCLALELEPRSAAARAHTRPLGMPIQAQTAAGHAAEVCEHPSPAEGCYGLRPKTFTAPTNCPRAHQQNRRSQLSTPTTTPASKPIWVYTTKLSAYPPVPRQTVASRR